MYVLNCTNDVSYSFIAVVSIENNTIKTTGFTALKRLASLGMLIDALVVSLLFFPKSL